MNREPSSPPRHHHNRRKVAALDPNHLSKPAVFLSLLLVSFVFGYLFASCFNPKPADLTSGIGKNEAPLTFSDSTYRFSTQCADPVPSELVRQTILVRVFNDTSPWENFPPPHIRPFLKSGLVTGWGSKGAVFENLIRRLRPKTIIEVGTFLGASAIHMAGLTRRLGLDTRIICIDDFRGWPAARYLIKDLIMVNGDVNHLYQFMQNVVDANATESILFMPFSSATVLEELCAWGVSADLIEVDAEHEFHSVWSDINRGYKLLRPGGIMFGHDYFYAADNYGVRRAVNLFARLNNLNVQIDGEHWVLTPPKVQDN